MNPIWSNLYDRFKDRRYGLLFVISAVASLGLVLIGKVVIEEYGESLRPFLPAFIPLGMVMIWRAWRRSRMPRERLKFAPLSCDEMRKARSKLVRSQKVG